MSAGLFSCLILLKLLHVISAEMDTIAASHYIRDVVWVANRDTPLTNTSGVFKVSGEGVLLLLNGVDTVWSSNLPVSAGPYVNGMDTSGYPQVFQRRGSVIQHRFGPWNGVRFSGFPSEMQNSTYTYEFVFNQKDAYFIYEVTNSSFRSRLYLTPEGNEVRLNWIDPTQGWIPYLATTLDICTQYGRCGAYGICNIYNSRSCSCMDGFEPLKPEEWNIANWSSGCRRKNPLGCMNGDGFQKISGVNLPDTRKSWYNVSMSLAECEIACKRNCSCTAYGNMDIRRGGSGCLLWFEDLMDIRDFDKNQDLYIRIGMTKSTGT
ncbi:hypothetical protein L1887_09354 [Cichorium endivia]|nr:hypothetical protein L1887_09354 [Cichorium endivia]